MIYIVDERYTRHADGRLVNPERRLAGRGGGERIWKRRSNRPARDGHPAVQLDHRMHGAWDIPGPEGTPVHAVLEGEVVWAGMIAGYGHTVIVLHREPPETEAAGGARPVTSAYCHMDDEAVALGDNVSAGGVVGHIGCTYWDLAGRTGGVHGIDTHLHFSVQLVEPHPDRTFDDRWRDPSGWQPSPSERPAPMMGTWDDGNLTVRTGRRFATRGGERVAVTICAGFSSAYEEDWSRQVEPTSWLGEIYGEDWQEAERFLGLRQDNETPADRRARMRRQRQRRTNLQP